MKVHINHQAHELPTGATLADAVAVLQPTPPFAAAVLLTLLLGTAAALIGVGGIAYVGLFKAVLLLTAAFAAAGMACGLLRGLRGGNALKTGGA